MTVIPLSNSNIGLLSTTANAYFVIESEITLLSASIMMKSGCVLDFRGGSFTTRFTNTRLIISGAKVFAPSYCIFGANIEVIGFTNDVVKSEWFRTDTDEAKAINRAIKAAAGCPVELECRDYQLNGSIVFDALSTGITQTLISPGTLLPDATNPAIRINTSNVNLKINRIEGKTSSSKNFGIGIEITGTAQNCTIDVNEMFSLEKAFAICPQPEGNSSARVENCKFYFQSIRATTCFYVSLPSQTWFKKSFIFGGRMTGENGIFFEKRLSDSRGECEALVFDNIGFEGLDVTPIQLCGVSQSTLSNLRMAEALPGMEVKIGGVTIKEWDPSKKWISLIDSSNLRIGIKTTMRTNRIDCEGVCSNIIVEGFAVENEEWPLNVFDRLLISRIQSGSETKNIMTATSSVQPFNICKSIEATSPVSNPEILYLSDLIPHLNNSYGNSSQPIPFDVIPRTLNVKVGSGKAVVLDVTSLAEFAPCSLADVLVDISAGGQVWFRRQYELDNRTIIAPDGNIVRDDSSTKVMFNESALYRLTFDEDWNLVITRVVF